MKTYLLPISLFATTFFIISCAHHKDVRPGADGVNRVIVRGPEKTETEDSAIRQANHYCESIQKSAAFISEDTKYTGDMDEKTHHTLRNASKTAMVLGSGVSVMGGDNERPLGQVAAGAGMGGAIMTDGDAYTADMKFTCK